MLLELVVSGEDLSSPSCHLSLDTGREGLLGDRLERLLPILLDDLLGE